MSIDQAHRSDLLAPRRVAREVQIGDLVIGGNHPIRVQTMTATDTADAESTIAQIEGLVEAGAEIMRVTVDTPAGQLELSIQDLFPQTGPFAARGGDGGVAGRRPGAKGARGARGAKPAKRPPDRPIRRRSADSKAAHKNLQVLLDTPPGEQVFVIPFNKRATLIRIDKDKSQATVQSGIFEMEIPLADLEPVRGS